MFSQQNPIRFTSLLAGTIMDETKSRQLIDLLDLQPHPEGGYFRETYRAEGSCGGRRHSTAIYYLLEAGQCSRLHRIKSDELWHFYWGDVLTIVEIGADGSVSETALGTNIAAGQRPQHIIKAGRWFGAYLPSGSSFALVGCTVAPGFEFADFELAEREKMLKEYPGASEVIERLT